MKEEKIGWKMLLSMCVLILGLFLLLILIYSDGSSMAIIHEEPPTFLDEIGDWLEMRLYLLVEWFPVYIIPLLIDIGLICLSKSKINND